MGVIRNRVCVPTAITCARSRYRRQTVPKASVIQTPNTDSIKRPGTNISVFTPKGTRKQMATAQNETDV